MADLKILRLNCIREKISLEKFTAQNLLFDSLIILDINTVTELKTSPSFRIRCFNLFPHKTENT